MQRTDMRRCGPTGGSSPETRRVHRYWHSLGGMGEVVPGFPEVAGESCTTEDVQGQEITFRNLVPVAGSSRAVL